ncbi:IS110 family transposase [Massilia sp. B-10]|nr:IS110 family transposase [Massilia sp. B-10]UUZ54237.1 IS110 family transposase [Massilia sp. H-1]
MSKYSGIDLHSNNCVVVVSDDDDKVFCERRVPNDLSKVVALLDPYRSELVSVAVESTFNWYWLVDGLRAAGFDVKLVNTAAIAQYSGLKYSGDEHDARHLAHLLRLNLLKFGYAFEPEWRAVRDLARKRQQLVRTRTTHVLAFQSIYARDRRQHRWRCGEVARRARCVEVKLVRRCRDGRPGERAHHPGDGTRHRHPGATIARAREAGAGIQSVKDGSGDWRNPIDSNHA